MSVTSWPSHEIMSSQPVFNFKSKKISSIKQWIEPRQYLFFSYVIFHNDLLLIQAEFNRIYSIVWNTFYKPHISSCQSLNSLIFKNWNVKQFQCQFYAQILCTVRRLQKHVSLFLFYGLRYILWQQHSSSQLVIYFLCPPNPHPFMVWYVEKRREWKVTKLLNSIRTTMLFRGDRKYSIINVFTRPKKSLSYHRNAWPFLLLSSIVKLNMLNLRWR